MTRSGPDKSPSPSIAFVSLFMLFPRPALLSFRFFPPFKQRFLLSGTSFSSMSSRQQPPWRQPVASPDAQLPPLKVWNSLTKSKTPFIPIDPAGKKVVWYACGPTVYDDAHLGHARNYVSTDIIRRIMRDYFKFDVKFVMNITDVDDKVWLGAVYTASRTVTHQSYRSSSAPDNNTCLMNLSPPTLRLPRRS